MAAIEKISLEAGLSAADCWPAVAGHARAWAAERGVHLRDALVLLPFAQLLPPARQAFARGAGWAPRIETTQTLARCLGPGEPGEALQIRFDTALDRLAAAQLLRGQGWAQALATGDAVAYEHLIAALVQTAQALAQAAAALAPAERAAHWGRARAVLAAHGGPDARERLLARIALEWAAAGVAPASDALHDLRPSAWIVVQAGGADALCRTVLAQADAATPCLLIDTDAPADAPFDAIAAGVQAEVAVCEGFEDEAQQCAAQVLGCLADLAPGAPPVALVAQDRVLVRRVRALLARDAVPLLDETGWRLSTTRAGALLASLLRAAAPQAATDDWLDWLKPCIAGWPGLGHAPGAALVQLESRVRRAHRGRAERVDVTALPAAAAALWGAARAVVGEIDVARARPLAAWLDSLRRALQTCGAWPALLADDAGQQLLAALHLGADRPALPSDGMPFAALQRWVDAALEAVSFRPRPEAGDAAGPRVVVTPLARVMLRPFAAVVCPGADEMHLGATPAPQPLLGEAAALALGLPGTQARRDADTLAFVQLLRCPRVVLLRRVDDHGEPLAASPLIERLNLARQRAGHPPLPAAADARRDVVRPAQPVPRPLPVAAALLPARLSASACVALRACPYRFFALQMLHLQAADELDDTVEKRDYGTWLHAVLHRFHRDRGEAPLPSFDAQRLHVLALEVRHEMALDDAEFLPFAASFARLVPAYLAWLHERDASGARWLDGECDLSASPPEWQGIQMHGRIDRVDSVLTDDESLGPTIQLIDYKTGSVQALQQAVAQPLEDTQLAYYAALMARQSEAVGPVAACYLALDVGGAKGEVKEIDHDDVLYSADRLVEGLGHDLARLRAGAPLPALGEGSACTYCDARGLCRRDHWAPALAAAR